MKQGLSPAVAVVVILIVVIVIAAIGYFVFLKPKQAKGQDPDEMMRMMDQAEKHRPQQGPRTPGGPGGGAASGAPSG